MQTAPSPIHIVRGKGVYLTAVDGTEYIDTGSSWWTNLHGHAHPYVASRIAAQAEELEHVLLAGFTHPNALRLASRLLAILPDNMGKVFYSDNGACAVEVAMKMAVQYMHNTGRPEKRRFISFKGGHHGETFGAMAVAGDTHFNRPFRNYLFEITSITPPVPGSEEKSMEEFKAALGRGDDVACFLFEPTILGAGGFITYSAEPLSEMIEACQAKGVITVADEVMTGFGRTGPLFVSLTMKAKPDIICLAKGLTGGFLPLGATVCTDKIYGGFLSDDKGKALLHGHSYTGNPIACASALASIDLLEKPECETHRRRIAASHEAFVDKWGSHPAFKRCEAYGTILIMEYEVENGSYFSSSGDDLYRFFLGCGLIMRPLGNTVYVMPPYCITNEELARIYDVIRVTLEKDTWGRSQHCS